ncbi:MAG: AURKAIP1/COX24 domain-containing protein [Planctomycetes bacterium]|nr:AURKAIP1/COX24 domain-containing protein [Planctomycetota bacterium]
MGSVLKWRRKKMNRHKYRLLRKKMRHRKRR